MRRLLLTTAAASLVMLAACSDAVLGARAIANDGGETRVHRLSGAEAVASSLRRDAAQGSDEACAASTLVGDTRSDTQGARRASGCTTGKED